MTVLVILKTMADQQSAWGSSLRWVLVVVQSMIHYAENSPGCSKAKYTNTGSRRQYTKQCWKPLLARWTVTDHIGTVTGSIRTVTGHIGTQTTVCLSRYIDLYQSLCNCQHTLSVHRFSFPGNWNRYIFFKPCEVPTTFPFINFSCKDSFFFGQPPKCLSADCLWCEHRRFYMATLIGLVLYILADLKPCGKLLTKPTRFVVKPHVWQARIMLQNFRCLFSPATISLASLHETHVCPCTRPFQIVRLRANSGQTNLG